MKKYLSKAIEKYTLCPHGGYKRLMDGCSQVKLVKMFTDLLTLYINDKNSSTLREIITVTLAGYQHEEKKIGYNGFKQAAPGKPIACEAKPKNVSSSDFEAYKRGERKSVRKLNGGGNFTDYNWKRFKKNSRGNLRMLVSGFVDGKLIYILEFPFFERKSKFIAQLREKLEKGLPKGDKSNRYVRSVTFNYCHFMGSKKLRVVYCKRAVLEEHKKYLVAPFYKKLAALAKDK